MTEPQKAGPASLSDRARSALAKLVHPGAEPDDKELLFGVTTRVIIVSSRHNSTRCCYLAMATTPQWYRGSIDAALHYPWLRRQSRDGGGTDNTALALACLALCNSHLLSAISALPRIHCNLRKTAVDCLQVKRVSCYRRFSCWE